MYTLRDKSLARSGGHRNHTIQRRCVFHAAGSQTHCYSTGSGCSALRAGDVAPLAWYEPEAVLLVGDQLPPSMIAAERKSRLSHCVWLAAYLKADQTRRASHPATTATIGHQACSI